MPAPSSVGADPQQTAIANADINQQLTDATEKGDSAAVDALLARGANASARNKDGWTTLMLAAFHGHQLVVER